MNITLRKMKEQQLLAVEGKIRTGRYLNGNGEKKYNVDIALTNFTFIDSKKKIVDEELAF